MDDIPQPIKDGLGNIKKTNFDRLVGDPNIREVMGIEIIDNELQLKKGISPLKPTRL